jgi:hypothetical protein
MFLAMLARHAPDRLGKHLESLRGDRLAAVLADPVGPGTHSPQCIIHGCQLAAEALLDREEALAREEVRSDVGGMLRGGEVLAAVIRLDRELRLIPRDVLRELIAHRVEPVRDLDCHGDQSARLSLPLVEPHGSGAS